MNYSAGPQADRDRQIWKQSRDVPAIERDDLLVDRDVNLDNYEGELSRLRRENVSLRDQVQRALKELKAYQTKYPSPYAISDEDDNSPPWASSPEVMTPLFIAYDSRIKELEDIISKQSVELDVFREKVASVLAENETLREAQLEQLRQKKSIDELGPVNALSAELLSEMNERVDILMAENALLVEQKAKMSASVEDLRLELSNRTAEVGMLVQRLAMLEEQLNSANQRLDQAERDREEAAGHTIALSEELGNAKTNVDILREQMVVWQTKCADAELALHEARKQLALINNQAEDNNLMNMRRTKAAEDLVRDLQSQLSQSAEELEAALDLGRKLRREYQSTRQDAEGMLQVCYPMSRSYPIGFLNRISTLARNCR
jgi:myosin protein heavy chain